MASTEPAHREARVAGRTVAYVELGEPDGVPVIAMHGCPIAGLAYAWWADQVSAAGCRLMAPDRPGCGRSDRQPRRSYLSWADDMRRLADGLGIERLLLLGWSSGGPYALACAAQLPERVDAVALVGSIAPPTVPEVAASLNRDLRQLYFLCRRAPLVARLVLLSTLGKARRQPAKFVDKLGDFFPADADRSYLAALRQSAGEAAVAAPFREVLRQGPDWVVVDQRLEYGPWGFELADVTAPVHAWHGADDQTSDVAHSRYLAEHLRHCDLRVIPAAGHVLLGSHMTEILTDLRQPPRP